jgi:LacI family gluconate utilization system Gnt-I transcriptional repressor
MRDVAREAGVSAMTVSRALKTPDKVAAATRERVRQAVRKLGYVPNHAAGSLSSRDTQLVTALLSTLTGSIFTDTVAALTQSLRAADCQLLIGTTDYSPESEEALIASTLGRRPSGIVLTSGEHTEATRNMLRRSGVPVVELWELPEEPIDMAVGFSNYDAGRCMTRFLYELGYRRIATMGSLGRHDRRAQRRQEGYAETVRALGIGPARIIGPEPGLTNIEAGAAGLSQLRERWPEADAVFCTSDAVALGAIAEARRRGLGVPADIAIAGLGDVDYAGPAGFDITTLRVPSRAMGSEASRLLIARRRGELDKHVIVDVGFKPIRRASA